VLPGPTGGEIQVIETTCHGTDEMQIFVTEPRRNRKYLVFAYDRMNADPAFEREDVGPHVAWVGAGAVTISIDMVAYIRVQRKAVAGLQINYQVGRILYPKRSRS
jgi:hypothetical protein